MNFSFRRTGGVLALVFCAMLLLRARPSQAVPASPHTTGDYWGVVPGRTLPGLKPYFQYGCPPFVYADYLVSRPGTYSVILAARANWQGPSVWQSRTKFSLGAGAAARTAKGPEVNLPPGNYWLTAHVFNAQGRFLYRRAFQVDVVRRKEPQPPLAKPVRSPWALEVRTAEPENVFPTGVALRIEILPPAGAAYPLSLEYQVKGFYGKTLLEHGTQQLSRASAAWWSPHPAKLKAGHVYQVSVQCVHGGTTVDTARAMFGLAEAAPHVPAGPEPSKRPLVNGPSQEELAATAYWDPYWWSGGSHYPFRDFEKLVALARRSHCGDVRIDLDWATLEPLPGVYRWGMVDRMVQAVKAAGLNVAFQVYGFYQVPPWMRGFPSMADNVGDIHNLWYVPHGVSRVPSPSSRRFLSALCGLWRALVTRYGRDPDVAGYYFLGMFSDHFYFDAQPGTMVDYSVPAQRSFRVFLQKHYTLARLNHRYRAHFTSWRQVCLPQPQVAHRRPSGLNPRWVDFMAFRRWTFQRYVRTQVQAIRSVDRRGWIRMYFQGQAPMGSVVDYLYDHGVALADGGDEQEARVRESSPLFYLRHMGDFTESVSQMPRSRFTIWMLFTKLYYSGQGGDFRWLWNMSMAHNPVLRARWLNVMKYFNHRWKPALDAMYAARAPRLDLAVLAPVFGNAAARYLDSYWASQAWPSVWLGDVLLQDHQFPYWVGRYDHPAKDLRGARLAFVAGNMMIQPSSHYWDAIVAWVRRGGKLVLLSPASGRWALNHLHEDFYLLDRLGVHLQPTGRRLHDPQVVANGQGIFARGRVVPLSAKGLDGRPGFEELRPTGRPYRTLATFSDGRPAVVSFQCGKGQVVLFLQTVDCFKLFNMVPAQHAVPPGNVIEDLCHWAKVKRFFTSNQPAFRLSLLNEGRRHFLLVHRYQPPSWWHPPQPLPPQLSGLVKLYTMADGSSYAVANLLHPHAPRLMETGRKLRTKGLTVKAMVPGETRIYEISPQQ